MSEMKSNTAYSTVHPIPGPKYFDVPQSALYLCVSVACIRKWCSNGKLMRYKAGRRVLIKVDDLEAIIVSDKPAACEAA
jgi:excisionase family DNA binding protein